MPAAGATTPPSGASRRDGHGGVAFSPPFPNTSKRFVHFCGKSLSPGLAGVVRGRVSLHEGTATFLGRELLIHLAVPWLLLSRHGPSSAPASATHSEVGAAQAGAPPARPRRTGSQRRRVATPAPTRLRRVPPFTCGCHDSSCRCRLKIYRKLESYRQQTKRSANP